MIGPLFVRVLFRLILPFQFSSAVSSSRCPLHGAIDFSAALDQNPVMTSRAYRYYSYPTLTGRRRERMRG